jgi:glucokinase
MSEQVAIGVDVGGTKVAAGLVDARGQILTRTRRPMVARRSAEEALAAVLQVISAVRDSGAAHHTHFAGIGISTPGYVDVNQGRVLKAANLPCWIDYPLGPKVAEAAHLAVKLENDGNAAALAEALWGAGAGYRSVFYVTLGTGIGTGIVSNGRVVHGRTGSAGEGGHIVIDYRGPKCPCGKRGCIEQYAAGPAIARRAREKLVATKGRPGSHAPRRAVTPSRMLELAEGRVQGVTAEIVGKASLEGDVLATEVLRETAEYLAIWLGGIIDLLEPEVFVIGGGLGHLMANFLSYMRAQLEHWSIAPRAHEIPIVSALYGAVSGIAGAAALCLNPNQ